jgi:phosphoglycerol transferase
MRGGSLIKESLYCCFALLLCLLSFALIFQVWNVDFALPAFSYGEDGLFYFLVIKMVVESGWFFSSNMIGMPHLEGAFYLHDFPIHSELLNISLIKIFSFFTSNVFLIANLFFLTTFVMICAAAFISLRVFGVSVLVAGVVAILYAFLPYHFARGVWHLFLSNYSIAPLAVMLGYLALVDKIKLFAVSEKGCIFLKANRFFWLGIFVVILAAISGIYYAYYSLMTIIFCWFLRGLSRGKFFDCGGFSILILCLTLLFVAICVHLPFFIYIGEYGANHATIVRSAYDSEFFGLRLFNLLLPIQNHYLDFFAKARLAFEVVAFERESFAESLGFVGSIGMMFSLLWLITKDQQEPNSIFRRTLKKFELEQKEQEMISRLVNLCLLMILFATVGGFVMFISINFATIRSHARFCVFIGFVVLVIAAIIIDVISRKNLLKKFDFKGKVATTSLFLILVLGLLDQVGYGALEIIQSQKNKEKFFLDREFVGNIEAAMPTNSAIFVVPAYGFPESDGDDYNSLIGYLHAKNLRWSYPAIKGRAANLWQKKISELKFEQFIGELKSAGFSGLYLDRKLLRLQKGEKELQKFEENLRTTFGEKKIISRDERLVFYRLF